MSQRGAFPFAYEQIDFANGLRAVVVPLPHPHVVTVQIVVHAGSRNEVEEGRSGFAHFFEHMMFRGTPEWPPERYEAALQEMGASSNAYTDDDRTVYHTTVTRPDLETVLAMEADRFQNLRYPEEDFRTEALAVLGEYHKDSAEPHNKLLEVLRDTAFDVHPYKHTTMGFLRDIERMPEMYAFSRTFFDRFYRPENTTIILAGDLRIQDAHSLLQKHWGAWQRGTHRQEIPPEPAQTAPREVRIAWDVPALPLVAVAFRAPAYSDTDEPHAALDLISLLGFSESSPLFEKLVIETQVADAIWASNPDRIDPYLFTAMARVKDPAKVDDVRRAILDTLAGFSAKAPPDHDVLRARDHIRNRFAMSLDHTEAIGETLAHYVSLTRSPKTIDRRLRLLSEVTPAAVLATAKRIFVDEGRTVATLAPKEGVA